TRPAGGSERSKSLPRLSARRIARASRRLSQRLLRPAQLSLPDRRRCRESKRSAIAQGIRWRQEEARLRKPRRWRARALSYRCHTGTRCLGLQTRSAFCTIAPKKRGDDRVHLSQGTCRLSSLLERVSRVSRKRPELWTARSSG